MIFCCKLYFKGQKLLANFPIAYSRNCLAGVSALQGVRGLRMPSVGFGALRMRQQFASRPAVFCFEAKSPSNSSDFRNARD